MFMYIGIRAGGGRRGGLQLPPPPPNKTFLCNSEFFVEQQDKFGQVSFNVFYELIHV